MEEAVWSNNNKTHRNRSPIDPIVKSWQVISGRNMGFLFGGYFHYGIVSGVAFWGGDFQQKTNVSET